MNLRGQLYSEKLGLNQIYMKMEIQKLLILLEIDCYISHKLEIHLILQSKSIISMTRKLLLKCLSIFFN